MNDLVRGKEHFEKKLKDLGIDESKIDGDLRTEIERINKQIEKRMRKDGVPERRDLLYKNFASEFLDEFENKYGFDFQSKFV